MPKYYQASPDGKEFFVGSSKEHVEKMSNARATPLWGTVAEIITGLLGLGAMVIHLFK